MINNKPLIQGWGIKDIEYRVYITENVNGRQKKIWTCPYYKDWCSILDRCFCLKTHERQPTYRDCTVGDEWKRLSDFIKWVDSQPNKDWQNCVPDKDILVQGNKHYSPETVVYVSRQVNSFIVDASAARSREGATLIGTIPRLRLDGYKYEANCRNPFTNCGEYLGLFNTELEAHLAWKAKKCEHACKLADLQSDERVAKRLREMYSPDKHLTDK